VVETEPNVTKVTRVVETEPNVTKVTRVVREVVRDDNLKRITPTKYYRDQLFW